MTRSRLWYDESLEPGSGGDMYFRLLELCSTHTHTFPPLSHKLRVVLTQVELQKVCGILAVALSLCDLHHVGAT